MPFLLKNKQGNLTDIFLDICNVCDKTLKKKSKGMFTQIQGSGYLQSERERTEWVLTLVS